MAEIFIDRTATQMFPNREKRLNARAGKLASMFRLGHKIGTVPGSRIDDATSLRKTLILCFAHRKKFNARAYNYFEDRNLPDVVGTCEECGLRTDKARLLMHESYVASANNQGTGTWYIPRQDLALVERDLADKRSI